MPRTDVMLIGNLGSPYQDGFPGAGGPIPPSFRSPYTQPNFRMNRHMPIPSSWSEPQNLLQVSDKTNYNPAARASGGRAVTPALAGLGNAKKLLSPVLFGLGSAEDDLVQTRAALDKTLDSYEQASRNSATALAEAESWRTSYIMAATGTVILGATMAAIHGYRRNKGKTGYAVLWGIAGGIFPILTNGVALVQGYAKPAGG